jgi:hypothetical protein
MEDLLLIKRASFAAALVASVAHGLAEGAVDPARADTAMFQIRGEVVDADSRQPLPCRVYIQGSDGSWHFPMSASPDGSAVEYRKQKDWNPACVEMHTTLSAHPFIVRVPAGTYAILVERGKEYLPASRQLKVDKGDIEVTIPLQRWINMAERKWYSGDTHVHRPISELSNVLLAEDLNVGFPLTSWVTEAFVPPTKGRSNDDQKAAAETIVVDQTHVIYPRNTEYEIFTVDRKSHTLGAFFVLGHKTLFQEGVPPVRPVGRRAREEGALLELDKHNWPWSMMLVPILRVDLFELANNHLWRTEFGYRGYGDQAPDYMRVERDEKGWTERGWVDYGLKNYYALLDCGFRLRPTAGTASGVHPVPLGFGRVYVHIETGFSYDAWIRGLNEGRSFVTTGPMLTVQVNGKDPGTVFKSGDGVAQTYRFTGVAMSVDPLGSIEMVVNGEVVRFITTANQKSGHVYRCVIDEELTVNESSWVAVRCFEDRPDKRIRFAHTAPFYIEVPDKPLRPRRAEIEFLISRIEGELARNADVLPAAALDEYREALGIYKDIARHAR